MARPVCVREVCGGHRGSCCILGPLRTAQQARACLGSCQQEEQQICQDRKGM